MQVTRVAQVGEAPGVVGNSGTVFSGRSEKAGPEPSRGAGSTVGALGGPSGCSGLEDALPAPSSTPAGPAWAQVQLFLRAAVRFLQTPRVSLIP